MDGSISAIYSVRRATKLARPLFGSQLPAGFPVLAEDWVEERIDLNRDLIFHPLYTYYAKIAGDSMIGEGLYDGSLVAFDSKLEARDGDIVVARVGCSDLCCKIYRDGHDAGGRMQLTGRLFTAEMLEKFRRVMPVVDGLNRKYGRGTVRWAVAKPNGRWQTKAGRCSPHYTTRLSDIPTLY